MKETGEVVPPPEDYVDPVTAEVLEKRRTPQAIGRKPQGRTIIVIIGACLMIWLASFFSGLDSMLLAFAGMLAFLVLGLFVYFAPALIAAQRNHRNIKALFVLNLFLGWTVLGWVGALVWAYVEQERKPERL